MIEGGGRERPHLPVALRALARAELELTRFERAYQRLRKRARREPLEALVRLDWRLGDEIMALPVFEALATQRGPLRISARVRYPELLEGNPYVAAVNPLSTRPDLDLELRGEIVGEARRTTLERAAAVDLEGILPRVYLTEEERRDPIFPNLARLPWPRVALHAGTSQACKSWGLNRWRALARTLVADGIAVVEVGLGRETLGVGLDLVGRTPVRALARALAHVNLVVGDDSGPLHLALAVGTRAVGVFGSTDPALLYRDGALGRVLATSDCRFCWPRHELAWPEGACPLVRHECMESIPLAAVRREVNEALARTVGATR